MDAQQLNSCRNIARLMLVALAASLWPSLVWAVDAPPATAVETVDKLVAQLAAEEPTDRDKACLILDNLPPSYLSLVQAAAKREDLLPDARRRLHEVLVRLEPRCRLRQTKLDWARERDSWRSKIYLEYYLRDGHTNPKWDDLAKKAIELDGKFGTMETLGESREFRTEEKKTLDAAFAAGCDDPDVLAMAGLFAADNAMKPADVQIFFEKAMKSAADGKVSPFAKMTIDGRVLRYAALHHVGITHEQVMALGHVMDDMVSQYLLAMKLPGVPKHVMYEMADNVMLTASQGASDLKPIFDKVYPPLTDAVPNDSYVMTLEGWYWMKYAWQARGNGWGNTVTPQGWKDFAERLQKASEVLGKAADMDPANPRPATEMLTVVMGLDGDRDMMEKWFKRAMDADPDNTEACTAKLYYLEPKWHGDADAMVEFGRQCLNEGNWHARIPFVLVDAHIALSKYEKDPVAYFRTSGAWDDLNAVYSKYVELEPKSYSTKSSYCYYACLCGKWKVANQLFNELGDKADPTSFGGVPVMVDYKKRAADAVADNAPAQP